MEKHKTLDSDIIDHKKEYRIGAILLEFLPILVSIIYPFITGETLLLVLLMPMASLIYLTFGWYIFKKKEHQRREIIIAELIGVYFLLCAFSFLFILESFPYGKEMTMIAFAIGFPIEAALLIRYSKNRIDKFESRFSLKLFSRVVIFHLIISFLLFKVF